MLHHTDTQHRQVAPVMRTKGSSKGITTMNRQTSLRSSHRVSLLRGAAGALFSGLLLMAVASTVQAQVLELHAIDSERGKMLVAVHANGVVFIDAKKGEGFRAFKAKRKAMRGFTPDWFIVRDVDSNNELDIINTGQPPFLVTAGGNPIYSIPKGCDQFHVADFTADKSQDILCRKKSTFEVYSYDGQKLWQYKIQGLKLGLCNFGDANGDLKEDIECSSGKGKFFRLSGNGEEIGRNYASASLDPPADDTPGYVTSVANYLKGNELFDLNGDGTKEEWVKLDGTALVVGTKASPKAIARHETGVITSIVVDDLDGDGKLEIAAGSKDSVYLIDDKGKLTATIKANPSKLKRKPSVTVQSINANGLEDESDATNVAAIEKHSKKLSACYAGNVKKNPFTRVGRMIWNLNVDKAGKVSKVERLHSDLSDKKVEGCFSKVLKKITFSKGKSPDSSVTATFEFGFLDQ